MPQYGISRPTLYKWLHRYEELGDDGLRDGPSRPHHSPLATKTEIVGKIIYLRRHYRFGPRKISMYLHLAIADDIDTSTTRRGGTARSATSHRTN